MINCSSQPEISVTFESVFPRPKNWAVRRFSNSHHESAMAMENDFAHWRYLDSISCATSPFTDASSRSKTSSVSANYALGMIWLFIASIPDF